MKYSILMPYHNRAEQLRNTLLSFRRLYKGRKDYEVIIVEDCKTKDDEVLHAELDSVLEEYFVPEVLRITGTWSQCNPSASYNEAAKKAQGWILIITNPECIHEVDILAGLDDIFDKDSSTYVVCGCKALKKDGSFLRWHQHSVLNNKRFHFCSALSLQNYITIGGFDTRFVNGYCFDDDAFRARILQAGIEIRTRDDLLVEHQWHEKVKPPDWKKLWERNKKLYEENYGKYQAA